MRLHLPRLVPAVSLAAFVLVPALSAQTVDVVGGSVSTANGSARAKGNSYEVATPTVLIEAEFWLDFTGAQDLRFTVHSSPTEFGLYSELFQRTTSVMGTGLGYYSSGPLSVPFSVGEHYIVAVSWPGNMTYFFSGGDSQLVSFGSETHGYAVGSHPLPVSFSSNTNDQAIYAQRLTTSSTGGGIGAPFCGPAVANSSGAPAAMSATGSAVVASNDLTLVAASLPPSAFGFFLTSTTQGSVPQPGGSQGVLCLGGAIGRYVGPGQIQNAGGQGQIALLVDLTQHPTPTGFVAVQAGQTWSFQAWYRDAVAGAATSNFSDGLAVTFQ